MAGRILNAHTDGLPDINWATGLEVEQLPKALIQLAALYSALAARLPMASTSTASNGLIDAPALAQVLGCPESHVRTLARSGEIPFVRVGKYMRFDSAAVRAALAAK